MYASNKSYIDVTINSIFWCSYIDNYFCWKLCKNIFWDSLCSVICCQTIYD